jgi:hypothetical protein
MSVETLKAKASKSACVAGVAMAAVFFGLDDIIANTAVGTVRGFMPNSLMDPLAFGSIVFAVSLFYEVFVDSKVNTIFS